MRLNYKHLKYGVKHFIESKKLSNKQVRQWIESNYKDLIKTNNKDEIINASSIIENNWKAFHTWVNQGLLNGTLKGKPLRLSNGTEEFKAICRIEWNKIPKDSQKVFNLIKKYNPYPKYGVLFQHFFDSISKTRLHRCTPLYGNYKGIEECLPSIFSYIKDANQIVEEDLIIELETFLKNKYKNE